MRKTIKYFLLLFFIPYISIANDISNRNAILGTTDNDNLTGSDAIDEIYGGTGNDVINGGEGADFLYGGTGNDVINGGEGADFLYGGTGNDVINGGKGADFLYGGIGADTFIVDVENPSVDTAMDFNALEGDTVLLNFENTKTTREDLEIPKELGFHNVRINEKGEVRIRLTNKKWITYIKLNQEISDLPKFKLNVKDNTENVHLTFEVRF